MQLQHRGEVEPLSRDAYCTIGAERPTPPSWPKHRFQQSINASLMERYRIERVLGEGAMGAVYLATDEKLQRQVALKIPKFDPCEDPELMQRFLREARVVASLQHRNICPVYDVENAPSGSCISMAYVKGRTLTSFMGKAKQHNQVTVARLVYKLALALASAHQKGIVHRDLKPDNIMIDDQRQPVIMDFGLAAMGVDGNTRLTRNGVLLGTPAYMSPEQAEGQCDQIDGRSDMFSLGAIFYELLCGQRPFGGENLRSLLTEIVGKDPIRPQSLRNDMHPRLESICLKMLSKHREDRFADMVELAQSLRDYLDGVGSSDTATSSSSGLSTIRQTIAQSQPKRHRVHPKSIWIGGTLAFVGLMMTIVVIQIGDGKVEINLGDHAGVKQALEPHTPATPAQAEAAPAASDQPTIATDLAQQIGRAMVQVRSEGAEMIGVRTSEGIVTVFPGRFKSARIVDRDGEEASFSVSTRSVFPFCWFSREEDVDNGAAMELSSEDSAGGWIAYVDASGQLTFESYQQYTPDTDHEETAAVFDHDGNLRGFLVDNAHLGRVTGFKMGASEKRWWPARAPR